MKTMNDFFARLRKAGIEIVFDGNFPTAAVSLGERGYRLTVGKIWENITERGKADLLCHELSHIVRGDLLAMRKYEPDIHSAVLAMDAIINEGIPDVLETVSHEGVTYNKLKKVYPNLPPLYSGWKPIYDHIQAQEQGQAQSQGQGQAQSQGQGQGQGQGQDQEQRQRQRQGQSQGQTQGQEQRQRQGQGQSQGQTQGQGQNQATNGMHPFDEHNVDMNVPVNSLTDKHIETINGLKREFQDACSDDPVLQEIIEAAKGAGSIIPGRRARVNPHNVALDPRIKAIFEHVTGSRSGVRLHRRTYHREGRLDGLRGAAKIPSLRCLLACDTSGSISKQTLEYYTGVAAILSHKYRVTTAAFASGCALWRIGTDIPPVGFGTLYQPIYGLAKRERAEVVIILTDGDNYDEKKPQRGKGKNLFEVYEVVTLSQESVKITKLS